MDLLFLCELGKKGFMQPAAHYSAAISILDEILAGAPAEKSLLSWSRSARFAGSKDRAAIRDIVFDCLRARSSYSARFSLTGRGLALGRALQFGELDLFAGEGYAPRALNEVETQSAQKEILFNNLAQEFDFPEFLEARLVAQYGDQLPALMEALRARAPVDLRVNRLKTDLEEAEDFLAREHIFVEELSDPDALRITLNPRKLSQSRAFQYGLVELQDLSSQIVSRFAQAEPGMNVLDYCAGGGGKSLALAMYLQGKGEVHAWDINPARMKEIPDRAMRADANVKVLNEKPTGGYDLVFVDAPCSGSGAWRRSPDAKWRLTQDRLDQLKTMQINVLEEALPRLLPNGIFVYATCSIFLEENHEIVADFLQKHDFILEDEIVLNPLNASDGFYAARMRRA